MVANTSVAGHFDGHADALEVYNLIHYTVILTIHIKHSLRDLGQPLRMAAHALDWGDSLN
jgi:hypothetical protein